MLWRSHRELVGKVGAARLGGVKVTLCIAANTASDRTSIKPGRGTDTSGAARTDGEADASPDHTIAVTPAHIRKEGDVWEFCAVSRVGAR